MHGSRAGLAWLTGRDPALHIRPQDDDGGTEAGPVTSAAAPRSGAGGFAAAAHEAPFPAPGGSGSDHHAAPATVVAVPPSEEITAADGAGERAAPAPGGGVSGPAKGSAGPPGASAAAPAAAPGGLAAGFGLPGASNLMRAMSYALTSLTGTGAAPAAPAPAAGMPPSPSKALRPSAAAPLLWNAGGAVGGSCRLSLLQLLRLLASMRAQVGGAVCM